MKKFTVVPVVNMPNPKTVPSCSMVHFLLRSVLVITSSIMVRDQIYGDSRSFGTLIAIGAPDSSRIGDTADLILIYVIEPGGENPLYPSCSILQPFFNSRGSGFHP